VEGDNDSYLMLSGTSFTFVVLRYGVVEGLVFLKDGDEIIINKILPDVFYDDDSGNFIFAYTDTSGDSYLLFLNVDFTMLNLSTFSVESIESSSQEVIEAISMY